MARTQWRTEVMEPEMMTRNQWRELRLTHSQNFVIFRSNLALILRPQGMSIFSRRNTQDAFAPENVAVEAETPPPIAQVTPEMMEDDNAMRRYIKERLIVESQMAPTAAARIAALRELNTMTQVSADTRYRVENKGEVTVNIGIVQSLLSAAAERTRRESLQIDLPATPRLDTEN